MSSDLNLPDFFSFNNFKMRAMDVNDIEETVIFLNSAFKYQELATGHKRTNPQHLKERMNELDCYVVTDGKEIIGTLALEPTGKILHFGLIAVSEDMRGSGLGLSIMKAIESYAVAGSFTVLELDFMSIAPWLEKYYNKHGFNKTGNTTRRKGVDLIQMRKNI